MTNFAELRVFLCTTPTSMRFSFDRLMGIAERTFNQDPLSGHLFLFVNHYQNRIKILYWDRDGFCIWYKRLERGVFETPAGSQAGVELDYRQLSRLWGGLDPHEECTAVTWLP
jgi:transposase